jgi:Putative transposase
VLSYLARYVFRIAIADTRIVALDERSVTIRYKQRKPARWRTCRMDGHEFVRRFLQHVLPKGFHKVRYSGLWHPGKRDRAAAARLLLDPGLTVPGISADGLLATH